MSNDLLKSLSTPDLEALQAGDLTKMSDQGLQVMKLARMRAEGIDPTPKSTGERVLAGIGDTMASGVRALGGGSLLEHFGLPGTKEEADRLDMPLRSTTAGKVGNVIGGAAMAAPVALVPGANTYVGATLLGGLTGAALTEGGAGDRAEGLALGAAGGAAGKALGDTIGAGARWLFDRRTTARANAQATNAQRDAALTTARDAGYVLPPADVKSGALNELLNGFSGKIKTAQVASARNQPVTDALARKELGLAAGDELTSEILQGIRNQAVQRGYMPVRNAGTVQTDQTYTKAIDAIAAAHQGAGKAFPGLADNGVMELTAKLQQPLFDAGGAVDALAVLRQAADKAYRNGDTTLGKANKAAANALEDLLDRHMTVRGETEALQAFREARELIAKTYSVQKALNDQTGQVSATTLAKQLEKGKPLSGELRTIAEVASAFPKATQSLKEAPKAVSPLDYFAGMVGYGVSPEAAALAVARPTVRSAILSQPYQSRMLTNSYEPSLMVDKLLLPAAQKEMLRRLIAGSASGAAVSLPAD